MIPKRFTSNQLKGKRARVEQDLINGGGHGVGAGAIVTIISAHYGVTIKSDKCPHCQQYTSISRVERNKLTLIDEHEADMLQIEKE